MSTKLTAFRIYLFALTCGLRLLLKGKLIEAIKLLIAPVGYWRFLPNAIVWNEAAILRNPSILDASSPKLVSVFLASNITGGVLATDLDDERIFSRWQMLAQTLGLKNYSVEYQDARHLTCEAN